MIITEIGHEYTRTFSEAAEGKSDSPRSKQTTAILSPMQQREARDRKKERFIIEFNKSAKYRLVRDRLKKAILRLAVEKYKKTAGPKGMSPDERNAFKAQLYTYLSEQLKITIEKAVDRQSDTLPADVVLAKDHHK